MRSLLTLMLFMTVTHKEGIAGSVASLLALCWPLKASDDCRIEIFCYTCVRSLSASNGEGLARFAANKPLVSALTYLQLILF